MKSLTLSPALREEDVLISKSASPRLSYHQAVDSYFIAGPGQLCQVATCSIELFTAFIQDCALTTKNPKVSEKALAGLDYAELLDRWYALDTLKTYGAIVQLYASIEEAKQGVQLGTVKRLPRLCIGGITMTMKTSDQKFYKIGGQVKAEIDVYVTREWDDVPSIEQCRHAVLTVRHKGGDGQMTDGYVVYDRLLCRIVNGVFYGSPDDALGAAQLYNEDPGQPQDMAPNGRALGLLYPKASL